MNEITELDNLQEKTRITKDNIFEKIWLSPRLVFQFLTTTRYDKHVTVLLILSGITRTFDRASLKNLGDTFSLWGVIGFCIILGGLFGWISYYLYAAMVSWTGRWLDGKANLEAILRVMAYAMFPSIIGLFFLTQEIVVHGNEIFKSDRDLSSSGLVGNIIYYASVILSLVLGIWSFVLLIIGIMVVQKFSVGKALLNLFLPAILFIGVIFILVLLFQIAV